MIDVKRMREIIELGCKDSIPTEELVAVFDRLEAAEQESSRINSDRVQLMETLHEWKTLAREYQAQLQRFKSLANEANLMHAEDVCAEMVHLAEQSSEVSLAQHDAMTQIETLSWVAEKLPRGVDITARYIANRLDELRRQARGG